MPTCKIVCPKCHRYWADIKYDFGGTVKHTNVKIVSGNKKKLKKNDNLACSLCGYEHTNWDVILSIANEKPGELKPGEEILI